MDWGKIYDIVIEIGRIAVPALLVIIGWYIVSRQNDRRERRKEIRSIIDELKSIILELREDCIEYYSEKNDNAIGSLSHKIKLNLLLVSQYLILLESAGMPARVSSELVAFRKTATGGYFETADFRKQAENPRWLDTLCSESAELVITLEKRYFTSFPIKMKLARKSQDVGQ